MKQLSAMNPAEEQVPLTFDFSAYLAAGETIASAAFDVGVWNAGVDPSPAALLVGSPTIFNAGTAVQQHASGGVDGCDYRIRCKATTQGVAPARVIALVSLLPVRNA